MKQMNAAKSLWRENADLTRTTLEYPFVRGLAEGSLPREDFQHYVAQDAYSLESFVRGDAGGDTDLTPPRRRRHRTRRPHAGLHLFEHPRSHNRLPATQDPALLRRPVAPQPHERTEQVVTKCSMLTD